MINRKQNEKKKDFKTKKKTNQKQKYFIKIFNMKINKDSNFLQKKRKNLQILRKRRPFVCKAVQLITGQGPKVE